MKKWVVYGSALVMFVAVIAMSVGFSAAWFANVTESSSPILIGSDRDSAYVVITNSTLTGDLRPAILKEGYLINGKYTMELDGEGNYIYPSVPVGTGTLEESSSFKAKATIASCDIDYKFDGQPDTEGGNTRTMFIDILGAFLSEPTEIKSNGLLGPKANLGENYISYIDYKLGVGEINKNISTSVTPGVKATITCKFNFNKADELMPSSLITNQIYILLKISAINETNN